ncbi:hypothetical protein V1525DRAFT_430751 [Lipomyces kononenkoae]|uniref:Uncharacterized protein n=1 Tax=Lipomyces kononenkoae TaxID=34357 RepID=A0ACC3T6L5_LIPKO
MQSPYASKRQDVDRKPLTSGILFPEISKRFKENPTAAGSLLGLFIFSVLRRGKISDEWSLLFNARNKPPEVHHQAVPLLSHKAHNLPIVVIELEDRDLIKYITGSLTGLKGVTSGKIKIAGDVDLALKLEDAFVNAGGVEQTLEFLRRRQSKL